MARRQGVTREHVFCDLRPRRNAGAGPFSTQPSGPQFFERISASLARPVSQRIQPLRLLLEIRPQSLRRLASHSCYTTLELDCILRSIIACFLVSAREGRQAGWVEP